MIYMTLIYIIYLGYAEFFETRGAKSLEILNESVFVLIMYNFVLLNNLLSDQKIIDLSGDLIIAFTAFLLALNMTVIIYVSIKALIWKFHLRKVRKKAEQDHRDRMAKRQIMQDV